MNMRNCVLLVLCLCLVGCDPAYPPVIVNQYSAPIELSVSFNSGDIWERGIRLAPGTAFVQRRKGLIIEEITVKESSGKMRNYGAADFEAARSKRRVDFEVWFLTEPGLKLGDKQDLRHLRARKHREPPRPSA